MGSIIFLRRTLCCVAVLAALAGCGRNYSPDTYASNAVQQANKAEQGLVVGVREVAVSAAGTVGTVTGAAAGGIAGSEAVGGPVSAFTALGGTVLGGLAGNAAEHVVGDTKAFEYIVRKSNGDLVSVTQKDTTPLALGQKVLVIAGNQARVVPDYTIAIQQQVPVPPATGTSAGLVNAPANPSAAKAADTTAGKPAEPADASANLTGVIKPTDPRSTAPADPAAAAGIPAKPPATDIAPALTSPAPTSP
jgi:outer membrane lipoprotein SlyB